MDNFIKVNEQIFKSKMLKSSEKLVYISLTSYLKYGTDAGDVFPSEETISNDTDLCVNTVKKCLKSLESKGLIKIEHRRFTSNLYTIVPPHEVLSKYADVEPRAKKQRVSVKDKIKKYNEQKKHKKVVLDMEEIKEKYNYNELVEQTNQTVADTFISIVYKALHNTDRIKMKNVLELTKEEVIYILNKFKGVLDDTKNNIESNYAYLLTMLNNGKKQYQEHLQMLQNQQNQTTTTPSNTYNNSRYQTVSADNTITSLPTCNKTIDTKNSFNNFQQRNYDYDAIYEQMLKPQYV